MPQAEFNLEFSQSGPYVPCGILNWVISNMVCSGSNYDIKTLANCHHPNHYQSILLFMLFTVLIPLLQWKVGTCTVGDRAVGIGPTLKLIQKCCLKHRHAERTGAIFG